MTEASPTATKPPGPEFHTGHGERPRGRDIPIHPVGRNEDILPRNGHPTIITVGKPSDILRRSAVARGPILTIYGGVRRRPLAPDMT